MLESVAPNLWVTPYACRLAGVRFDGRMTVARLASGALWLHSPAPIDEALAAELAALGPVAHVIAPNPFHNLHAAAAKVRYPEATLWGTPVLARRKPKVPLDADLSDAQAASVFAPDLACLVVAPGPKIDEAVFYHAASRTLIVTDLILNVHDLRGWWTRLFYRMVGVYGRLAQSVLWRRLTQDRAVARAAVDHILAWDLERIIMSHGDIITGPDVAARAKAAWWWMRGQAAPAASIEPVAASEKSG